MVRTEAETTKLRVVYDASSEEGKYGTSLNDCIHVGPPLTPLLFDILLRFRENKVVIISYIEKAFLNVEVDPQDRDCLRFLWPEDINAKELSVNVYRFNRVVFGVNCSPFSLNAVLRYHINGLRKTDADFAEKLARSFYVDDLVTGTRDVESGKILFQKAKNHMEKGGFHLRKWKSNDPILAKEFRVGESKSGKESVEVNEDTYTKETLGTETSDGKKVLGVTWDMKKDEFDLTSLAKVDQSAKVTKRKILSTIAKLFDPLGLVSPIIVGFKILFQELCCLKIGWVDEIPEGKQVQQWQRLVSDLNLTGKICIPRCLHWSNASKVKSCYLHGYGDASKSAYCAMIYLVYDEGQITT